jgi:hypothetical protein
MIALLTTYLHRPLTDSAPSVPSSTIPHNEHPGLVGEAIRPMPDPVAVTAVSLLAAKALEAFSGEAGKNAWAAVERLGQLIRRKFEGDKPAEEALAAMEARPTNQLQIQTLVEVLDIRAKHDQNFRGSLVKLVGEAEATGAIQIIKANISALLPVGTSLSKAITRRRLLKRGHRRGEFYLPRAGDGSRDSLMPKGRSPIFRQVGIYGSL